MVHASVIACDSLTGLIKCGFFREPKKTALLTACCVCFLSITKLFISNKTQLAIKRKKKNVMSPFYRWGSTASRLQPLPGGSLHFTTKFPEIPGTRLSQPWSHPVVLNMRPLDWASNTLTTKPFLHIQYKQHNIAPYSINSQLGTQ